MPPKWELPFDPWLPCNPISPDPDLIPPAATVPPFWPSHFAPPYLKAPADVSAVPFLELQSIVLLLVMFVLPVIGLIPPVQQSHHFDLHILLLHT